MKSIKKLTLLIAITSMFLIPNIGVLHTEPVMAKSKPDTCDSPTMTVAISAIKGEIGYNTSTLNAPKDTCVRFAFRNPDPDQAHDFWAPADSAINFPELHIHMANNTAGPNGSNTDYQNIQTPNKDISIEFWCEEPGHKAAGMKGTLVIGNGTSSPGFNGLAILIPLLIVGTSVIYKRKKLNR